jgi:tape measure domain-containing protein
MANNETVLKIRAEIENLQGLNQLKTALRKSSAEAKGADNDFRGLVQKVRELQAASVKSINNLNAQRDAFEALRRSADVTSKEFKEAREEIEKIDRALKEASGTVVKYSKNSINALRAQKKELLAVRDSADLMSKEFKEAGEGKGRGGGARLRGAAQIAGTVAGAGVFGGPEGAIGALGGGLVGGVGGAVLGGALGAQVGQLRKAAGEVAEYVAQLNLAKGALGGVSKDIVEYNQNLDFAREISKKYAIRLTDVIKGYTGVTAAAKANNLTVKETQAIYEGITVSGVAAGKSQEDLQALFLATTQVLSKGKASAEEISGQIGERIPGAVAKFAAANKISLQELAEQFKKGEVTIAKFVRFTEQQGEDYAEVAEALASGPEKAGVRLQIALDEMQESYGNLFLFIGAGFQDSLKKTIDYVNGNKEQFQRLIAETAAFAEAVYNITVGASRAIGEILAPITKTVLFIAQGLANFDGIPFLGPTQLEKDILREQYGKPQEQGAPSREVQKFLDILKSYSPSKFAGPNTVTPPAGDLDGDGNGPGKTKTRGPKRADFRDLEAAFARDAAEKVQKAEVALRIKIAEAQKQENKELVFALTQERELLKVNQVINSLREQIRQRAIQISEAQGKGLDVSGGIRKQLSDQQKLNSAILEKSARTAELSADRLGKEKEITAELDKQRKSFEEQFTDRQKKLGLISSSDYNKVLLGRKKEELADPRLGLTPEQQARGLDQFRQTIEPTLVEGLTQNIAKLKQDLEDLVNPINQITGAANAIGSAFSQSFTNAITGATSAKQALADFFKSVGSYFLDMAGQIIAKMVTLAILNSVVNLLPGGGFNLGSTPLGAGGGEVGGIGTLGPNFGIAQRAAGGPVSANTPYIVGERGPELMVPSTSGTVLSNSETRQQLTQQDSAMRSTEATRQQLNTQRNTMITNSTRETERMTEMMLSNPDPIDVRYESTVINNVEYVTAEQHRKGMAQAAERGRAMTLTTLQNSPRTRSRVGI